jgi:hypothetical protein
MLLAFSNEIITALMLLATSPIRAGLILRGVAEDSIARRSDKALSDSSRELMVASRTSVVPEELDCVPGV